MTATNCTTHHKACDCREAYRGWSISPAYYGWQAVSPNYDASWEGEEDGWVDNGEKAWGRTREECKSAVDEWFDEHARATDQGEMK